MATTDPGDVGWAKVELMGHKVLYGYMREQQVFGRAMVRIDCPGRDHPPEGNPDGPFAYSTVFSPDALYSYSPIGAAVCVAAAGKNNQPPVTRYDLPAPVFRAAIGPAEIDGDAFFRPEVGVTTDAETDEDVPFGDGGFGPHDDDPDDADEGHRPATAAP